MTMSGSDFAFTPTGWATSAFGGAGAGGGAAAFGARGRLRHGHRAAAVGAAHALEVFDAAGLDGGADELVLALEALGQHALVEALADEVGVGRALAGDDGAADVDEREDERRVEPLVLGLDMVRDSVVRNVGVESGDHCS